MCDVASTLFLAFDYIPPHPLLFYLPVENKSDQADFSVKLWPFWTQLWRVISTGQHSRVLDSKKKKEKRSSGSWQHNLRCGGWCGMYSNSCWCRNNKHSSSCDKSLQIAMWRFWDDKWLRAPAAAWPPRLWSCQNPFSWPGLTGMRRLVVNIRPLWMKDSLQRWTFYCWIVAAWL